MIFQQFTKSIKFILLGLLPLLAFACAPAGSPGTEESVGEIMPPETEMPIEESEAEEEASTNDLANINWTLRHTIVGGDAMVPPPEDSHIYFEITNEGVSGSAGCNGFNGEVTIEGNNISFGPLATTRRACAEEVMSYENAVLDILSQTAVFSLANNTLTLSNADGLPLAEFAAAEEKTLFVGPETAECVGVAPQDCLLVKENVEDEYTFFYDSIAGFTFEPGFEYELRVSVSDVAQPIPADASSLRYRLIEVVNQTAVSEVNNGSNSDSDAELTLTHTVWQWVRFEDGSGHNGIEVDNPASYTIEFMDDGTYGLQNDCNSGSGPYTVDGSSISIEPGVTTLVACGPDSLDQTFNQRLSEVVTFVLAEGQLFLNLKMDGGNLVFEPAQ